jgi:hypothetical protein
MKPDQIPPGQWLPLNEVFVRVRKFVGDGDLALRDIKEALANGKVASMERSLARSGSTRTRELSPKFWRTANPDRVIDMDHITVRSDERPKDCYNFRYFLRRSDVDKLWPVELPRTDAANEASWLRSAAGAKGKYDWERILIKAAGRMYETGAPKSLTALCNYIEGLFLPGKPPSKTQLESHLGPLYREFNRIDGK